MSQAIYIPETAPLGSTFTTNKGQRIIKVRALDYTPANKSVLVNLNGFTCFILYKAGQKADGVALYTVDKGESVEVLLHEHLTE